MIGEAELRLLNRIKDEIGPLYGSETICMLLHVLALREKPERVIELGTGLGVTTVWLAAAMEINGSGSIISYDNGAGYPPSYMQNEMFRRVFLSVFKETATHQEFMDDLLSRFGFGGRIEYVQKDLDFTSPDGLMESLDLGDEEFDWAFCDVAHGPREVEACLAAFLSMSAPSFNLFIDSASTLTESFLVGERLVEQLRRSKIPELFNEVENETARARLRDRVFDREFHIHHFVEQVERSQNSTMLIKAHPVDQIPYPPTFMR